MDELRNMATIKPDAIVRIAEEQGRTFKNAGIKTNQIRNFYAEINMMKLDFQELLRNVRKGRGASASNADKLDKLNRRMILLKPKLASAAGRQRKVKEVYQFVSLAIEGVKEASKHKNEQEWIDGLQNFFDLIESVVAYHKYYGDS